MEEERKESVNANGNSEVITEQGESSLKESDSCNQMETDKIDKNGSKDKNTDIDNQPVIADSEQDELVMAESTPTETEQIPKIAEKECSPKAVSEADKSKDLEMVDFKVVFNKKKYDMTFGLDDTVGALKVHLQDIISVPSAMQKIMIKGLAKDEMTLRKVGVVKGSKVMVIGSTLNDVLEVAKKPSAQQMKEVEKEGEKKESWSQMKQHKKVLERGKPEDAIPGIKNVRESLPHFPLSGMLNKSGGKVRLTFKLEQDQVWLGTKERTEKLPMNSIKAVTSEPIEGHEEFHIMALQLGPTEASRYFIYWVPAQFVESIKEAVLGKWQYF